MIRENAMNERFTSTIVIAASIIAAVRLARARGLIFRRSRGCGEVGSAYGLHFSMPHLGCGEPCLWGRWFITQRGVWPDGVVVDAPLTDNRSTLAPLLRPALKWALIRSFRGNGKLLMGSSLLHLEGL